MVAKKKEKKAVEGKNSRRSIGTDGEDEKKTKRKQKREEDDDVERGKKEKGLASYACNCYLAAMMGTPVHDFLLCLKW